MSEKVIYSMVRVGKTYPPSNKVLRDITLGFYHGAKIGVLGLNGTGKSTLLRIMAGVEDNHEGETFLSDGYTHGYLSQEPQLDNSKTVRQIVEEGAQETVDIAARVRRDQRPLRRGSDARRDGRVDEPTRRGAGQTRRP